MSVAPTADHISTAQPARAEQSRRTWSLVVIAVIGIGLAVAPLAFGMFARAPRGATMLAEFKPYMTETRLDGFRTDIATVDAAVAELRPAHIASNSPDYATLQRQWPQIHATMTDLLDTVHGNLSNYQAVAALPSFRLFPWFFAVPGLLIAGLTGLAFAHPAHEHRMRIVLAALGIGLLFAPVAFQMFNRAPKGGRMMTDFKTIETTAKVRQIQSDFATMAVGQGEIRVAALAERDNLSAARVAARYPKTAALDADWVHILNDMTPMIGAMSDNVGNYRAIAALPPFPMFPWFFAVPGALVAGMSTAARRSARKAEGVS